MIDGQPIPILQGTVVLIVTDDHAGAALLIRVLGEHGCEARASNPGTPIDPRVRYDAALIDLERPRGWGSGTVTALRSAEYACASLMLLTRPEPQDVAGCLSDGAVDCLTKPVDADALVEGVANAVRCTRRWRGRLSAARVQPHTPLPDVPTRLLTEPPPVRSREDAGAQLDALVRELSVAKKLTTREAEVLYWLLQGHRYADIASVLGIVERTAKLHAANLLRKLELESRHDLPRLLTGE